jgi:translation initiation factor 1
MSKKFKGFGGLVFSTESNFTNNDSSEAEESTLAPTSQLLYVSLDSKRRKGKTVTLVEGFVGTDDDLNELGKLLKSKCGVGGTVKDSEIVIQGNLKEKVGDLLKKEGYPIKFKG